MLDNQPIVYHVPENLLDVAIDWRALLLGPKQCFPGNAG
jgi:hypothetical protein